jgi:hypothetical protein
MWILNAQVQAQTQMPVAFVVGFSINEPRYFGFLFGALNFSGGPTQVSSPASQAAVSAIGASMWLGENFESACRQGVTFRIVSTPDMKGSARGLVHAWMSKFGQPLYRPMSLLDDGSDTDAWGAPPGSGSLLDDVDSDDSGLSFSVSLNFE